MHRMSRNPRNAKRKALDSSSHISKPKKRKLLSASLTETTLSSQKFIHTPAHFLKSRKQHYIKNKKSAMHPTNDFKRFEKVAMPKRRRIVFEYKDNYSAALSLPVTDRDLDKYRNDMVSLLFLSEQNILEHAARRVDLFFYTLVAYYNQQLIPMQGSTRIQHGRGRHDFDNKSVTQACHSSFFPFLIDDESKVRSLIATHFINSLNATVELPKFINEFDNELEIVYGCREKSLGIIKDVSQGRLDPMQGLHAFLQMMQRTFQDMLQDKRFYTMNIFEKLAMHHPGEITVFKRHVLEAVKKGTFMSKWDKETQQVNNDYFAMLLRLNQREIVLCQLNLEVREGIYFDKIQEIQQEIWVTSSMPVLRG